MVNNVLNSMQCNNKVYEKLISGLTLIGNFDKKIEVNFYDNEFKDDKEKIRLWCSDLNDNLFIFYGSSFEKTNLLTVKKETNTREL